MILAKSVDTELICSFLSFSTFFLNRYLPCAEKIGCAVDSMIQIFPEVRFYAERPRMLREHSVKFH